MTDSSARGRWSGWRNGIAARETSPGRLGQHGVDKGKTGKPGWRRTSQSCEGQRNQADHLGSEGQSLRIFKPNKLNIDKLGDSETTGIIGVYRLPRSIHRDSSAR